MKNMLTSHVLSPKSFQWLRPKRDEEADHLHRFIYNQCSNQILVINLREVTRYYCGNVIRNMIFSKRSLFGIVEEEKEIDALFTILEYVYSFSISDYLPWLSVFDLDGHKAILKKAYATANKTY
uniref:Cytochrome P450 n=1 Tax=Solanum tuberosum TaxID=4113 RepID=M1BJ71_SOLTU